MGQGVGAAGAHGGRDRIRVLVVDDDEGVHCLVAHYLADCELAHAYTGQQARMLAARASIDVVLLDLDLPDTTGLDLLEAGLGRDGPQVVVLSAHCRPSLVERARQLGAAEYLQKTAETFRSLPAVVRRVADEVPQRTGTTTIGVEDAATG